MNINKIEPKYFQSYFKISNEEYVSFMYKDVASDQLLTDIYNKLPLFSKQHEDLFGDVKKIYDDVQMIDDIPINNTIRNYQLVLAMHLKDFNKLDKTKNVARFNKICRLEICLNQYQILDMIEKFPDLLNTNKTALQQYEELKAYKVVSAVVSKQMKPKPIEYYHNNEIKPLRVIELNNYVVLDTEGSFANNSGEICALRFVNGNLVDVFKNHPKEEDDIYSACINLSDFLEAEDIIVAHGGMSDLSKINKLLSKYNKPQIRNDFLDTLSLSVIIFPTGSIKDHKLATIKKKLKYKQRSHFALDDCIVTAKFLEYAKKKLVDLVVSNGNDMIEDIFKKNTKISLHTQH